jgi:uncharacterized damage-inducible protein DinB
MTAIGLIEEMLAYSRRTNDELLVAAATLPDDRLDQPFSMGMGTLRRTLLHVAVAEEVWLERWRGQIEQGWGDESVRNPLSALRERMNRVAEAREAFVHGLSDAALGRTQTYRDSRGGLFQATLAQMLIQGLTHSIHHRAQAANMLRQLGADCPDMDFMMHVRRPA